MPRSSGPSRRLATVLLLFVVIAGVIFLSTSRNSPIDVLSPLNGPGAASPPHDDTTIDQTTLSGHAIAPKLGNETAKEELGRAAWKLLHTIMARFPDKPTQDESAALKSYIHLFQRLYPCGECAEHFGQLLKKFPPQVSSRSAAAAWACHVHNKVNERLKKELFDCANIGDFYDCGCAEDGDEKEEKNKKKSGGFDTPSGKPEMSDEAKEKLHTNGRDFNMDLLRAGRDV
ncbi:FAD-linked sulfhydryl oxidase ERV2 [Lecanosticta acicola]|uniref:Sulfhydryl oxidase n=1 Tax=Lecanosticta acicola TaxID=111012 RepID=A0AAI8Z0H1_9PEZI|nr:FAD-linked sulfhydryl oxidase ERV2 [Lecanosticta acicola]